MSDDDTQLPVFAAERSIGPAYLAEMGTEALGTNSDKHIDSISYREAKPENGEERWRVTTLAWDYWEKIRVRYTSGTLKPLFILIEGRQTQFEQGWNVDGWWWAVSEVIGFEYVVLVEGREDLTPDFRLVRTQ